MPAQIRSLYLFSFSQCVRRRTNQNQTITFQRDNRQSSSLLRVSNNAKLNRSAQDILHDARRATVFEINLCLRIKCHEATNDGRQFVKTYAIDSCNAHSPAHRSVNGAHTLLQALISCKNVAALFVKTSPGIRQPNLAPPAHALKKTTLELLLKPAHLLANSRLRHEITLRSLREAPRFYKVAENF